MNIGPFDIEKFGKWYVVGFFGAEFSDMETKSKRNAIESAKSQETCLIAWLNSEKGQKWMKKNLKARG